jgi:hypothetical protein
MGFPFQMPQLTSHVGYVSSLFQRGNVSVIQINASVNGGNSGGPLLDLDSGHVVGIVSRAEIGFMADQFDELIRSLNTNVQLLEQSQRSGARAVLAGIDPILAIRASQAAMLEIAKNLRRSANVGIGYAFSTNHLRAYLA